MRTSTGSTGEHRQSVLRGDLLLPAMVLRASALEHNLALMQRWCDERGVSLAPHGKTTMAPQLFAQQLDAGAWAITAATVSQAQVMRAHGVPRVLIASQVVDPAGLRWLASELDKGQGWVACLVDSIAGVEVLRSSLDSARPALPVLVELGVAGGRTGCRSVDAALEVARAVRASPSVALWGVETFEGVVHTDDASTEAAAVDRLVADLRDLAVAVADEGLLEGEEAIVSAGGSLWFDRVVQGLEGLSLGLPTRVLLRSGAYLTHDSGYYAQRSPFGLRAGAATPRLLPAIEVWAAVLSRPEPNLAIAGMGKRDVAHDIDLPFAQQVSRAEQLRPASGIEVFALSDQHAFLRVPEDDPLAPGDLLCFGVSHPCTSFDKWRLVPIVDDERGVVDTVRTFF